MLAAFAITAEGPVTKSKFEFECCKGFKWTFDTHLADAFSLSNLAGLEPGPEQYAEDTGRSGSSQGIEDGSQRCRHDVKQQGPTETLSYQHATSKTVGEDSGPQEARQGRAKLRILDG